MGEVIALDRLRPKALEFFAGIGLARMGLEKAGFSVLWSNDVDANKHAMYSNHFSEDPVSHFHFGDIAEVDASTLPQQVSLAWASSPCTDLSLAGTRTGLDGKHSGTFWEFIRILRDLGENRPPVAVLENVIGLATSHGGDDITAAIKAFNALGYSVDILSIDARAFVPQSRPRLFLVAALDPPISSPEPASSLRPTWIQTLFSDESLVTHQASLPKLPSILLGGFGSVVEEIPMSDRRWWDESRIEKFRSSLSPAQLERVETMMAAPNTAYRTAYRRTRNGVPRWEVRPDDIAGCLRTARGGSSKQAVVKMGKNQLHVRWMTPLEYARLMGADDYSLSGIRDTQVYFGFGDAVAVPVVHWLATHYLLPLINKTLQDSFTQKELKRLG